MQYKFAAVSLLAAVVSATTTTSATPSSATPSSSVIISSSAIPSSSAISSAIPSSLSVRPSRTPKSSSIAVSSTFVPTPSSSAIPSSTSVALASGTPGVTTDTYDCVYRGWGCDWTKSEYGYGSDYCGRSPFKVGHQLSSGNQVLAVSKDGSGDCSSKAGDQCCQVLADDPCRRGEKYLECQKLE